MLNVCRTHSSLSHVHFSNRPVVLPQVLSGHITTQVKFIIFSVPLIAFSSVQSLSCVCFFVTPWTAARQASLSITNSQSLLKLMSTESVTSVQPSRPLSSPSLLPSLFPSIRVFSNESVLHISWPKYWSLSFSISPSSKYSGLTSFRMD